MTPHCDSVVDNRLAPPSGLRYGRKHPHRRNWASDIPATGAHVGGPVLLSPCEAQAARTVTIHRATQTFMIRSELFVVVCSSLPVRVGVGNFHGSYLS
jgi:hypothetical protein